MNFFCCYFTIGVEVLYSDYIKKITQAVPDHLLLTETDIPGALKWLKKNDEVGMPTAIIEIVNALADLRASTPFSTSIGFGDQAIPLSGSLRFGTRGSYLVNPNGDTRATAIEIFDRSVDDSGVLELVYALSGRL
jgi:hypothetical protein